MSLETQQHSIQRLAKVNLALHELEKQQNVHCMGAQDAIGLEPALRREYDEALEIVIRDHAAWNQAPSVAWHPIAYYQAKWADACAQRR